MTLRKVRMASLAERVDGDKREVDRIQTRSQNSVRDTIDTAEFVVGPFYADGYGCCSAKWSTRSWEFFTRVPSLVPKATDGTVTI